MKNLPEPEATAVYLVGALKKGTCDRWVHLKWMTLKKIQQCGTCHISLL